MQSDIFTAVRNAMLAGTAAVAIVGTAHAAETMVQFNIPAQSLDGALKQFALKTNKDLLYSPDIVANRRAAKLAGRFTPKEALKRLLRGTGLTYREVSPNVFSLRAAQVAKRPVTFAISSKLAAARQKQEETVTAEDAANTGAVSGTAVDVSSGSALPGALIRVRGTKLETVTDERGQYYFPAVPRGRRILELDYLGGKVHTVSVDVTSTSRASANFMVGSEGNDEIVVYGFRSSVQKALNQQKNADNNSTVISSDLLGGFPAETVSEALRRVSGVAFGRDENTGEGQRLTVRGFSSEAINVQLNGLELQGTGFQRTIDLSGFLTDNISSVTIHKSLLPSHESTGSGGLVEIETKSGLDYGDFSLNLGFEGEQSLKSQFGKEFQANGTIAAKITPNLGVAATLQYRYTDRLNYDANVLDTIPAVLPAGFTSFFRIPASRQYPFDPAVGQQIIQGVRYQRRERETENIVGSLNFAWDVADHTRLRLDLQRNSTNSRGGVSGASINFSSASTDLPIPELGGEVRRRRYLTGFQPSVVVNSTDTKFVSDTISLRGDTELGRFKFKYKAGYSRAKATGENLNVTLQGTRNTNLASITNPGSLITNPDDNAAMTPRVVGGAFTIAPNGLPLPALNSAGMAELINNSRYNIFIASKNPIDNPTTNYSGEFQARYTTPLSFLDYVELGGKYNRVVRSTNGNVSNANNVTSQSYVRIFGRNTPFSNLGGAGSFSNDDLSGIGATGLSIPYVSPNQVGSIFNGLANFVVDDPSTAFNEQRFNFTDRTNLDPITDGSGSLVPTKTIEEKMAGYFESKLNIGKFSLVAGVRYERERRSGASISSNSVRLNLPGFRFEPRVTFVQAGLVRFDTTKGTVETWTPSFLATYRPNSNIVARLGYFRSTTHPDLRLLNRGVTYSVDLRPAFARVTLSEANPNLKPSTVDNFDLDLAYYFDDTPGLIRAGFFYKKVSNNFTNVAFTPVDGQSVRQRFLDTFSVFANTRPDLLNVPAGAQYLVNRPENGAGGTIWGVELEASRRLTFLPGFLSNFGVLANLTYTDGDFPTLVSARDDNGQTIRLSLDRPLRDQARWVYNVSLDYEKGGFAGRVIYTSQSATARTFDEFNLNTVVPAFATLDARFSYSFEHKGALISLFLEGDNLLKGASDSDIRETTSSDFGNGSASFNYPQRFQYFGGRTVTAGLRLKF